MSNSIVMIVSIVIGLFLGVLFKIGYDIAYPWIVMQISIIKNNRLFHKRVIERDKTSKKWVEVTGPDGHKILVDENTGWCPARQAFLPKKAIEALKHVDQMETDYSVFRASRIKSIASFYGMSVDTVEKVHSDMLLIKKDFYLGNINSFLVDLKNQKDEA